MSIGIVTSCYGSAYYGFLDEWSAAILELNTSPDWVTIAHDGVPEHIRRKIDDRLEPTWINDPSPVVQHPQVHVNEAIGITFTDWILKVDVDDLLYPYALDGWQDTDADIVSFGYRIDLADHPSRAITAAEILQRIDNPIGSCSPFRRWVWEMNEFRDLLYDDWAFWIEAAQAGAEFTNTGRVDYRYRSHPEQISRRIDHSAALQEIRGL